MAAPPLPRNRRLTIIAQDPSVTRGDGRILTTRVEIPAEELAVGPWGYRVQVVDFDIVRGLLYPPPEYGGPEEGEYLDPFEERDDHALVSDCRFHAQNVYALVMRTLARFELALGRRVSWQFPSHQLKVVPHALTDANAFYSRADEALLFGSFPALEGDGTVHTCLSHDIVVHETTHALLDGLRQRFIDPSSPDQAAFHEGFADVVALLSVFSLEDVVESLLDRMSSEDAPAGQIPVKVMEADVLRESALFGLAEQLGRNYPGQTLSAGRRRALRQASLPPSTEYLRKDNEEFLPAHRRGEILVAAMMNAFIRAWSDRLHREAGTRKDEEPRYLDRKRVVEDGADTADRLLTMGIRALDYTPPVHLDFSDYLSAIITADAEVRPDDSRFRFRKHLRESFASYGIEPAKGKDVPTLTTDQIKARADAGQTVRQDGTATSLAEDTAPRPAAKKRVAKGGAATQPSEPGAWAPASGLELSYERTHFEPMVREPDEVFRFVWENRKVLKLYETAFTKVLSVRPCVRIAPDGFVLKETVAEFYQVLRLRKEELGTLRIKLPEDTAIPDGRVIALYGGGTLIFDEFGRLRFYIHNSLDNPERQETRLAHLASSGFFRARASDDARANFAELHRLRALDAESDPSEEW